MVDGHTPPGVFKACYRGAEYLGKGAAIVADVAKKSHNSMVLIKKHEQEVQTEEDLNQTLLSNLDFHPQRDSIIHSLADGTKELRAIIPSPPKHGIGSKIVAGMSLKSREKEMEECWRKKLQQKMSLGLHVTAETLPVVKDIASSQQRVELSQERVELDVSMIKNHIEVNFRKDNIYAPIHNMLPQPTIHFVGREKLISKISRHIQSPQCRRIALVGLGGVGKSQLALRVVQHLVQAQETTIFWLDSSSKLCLQQSYLKIASHANLPETAGFQDVRNLLESNRIGRGIMVFDSLDDRITSQRITDYLPRNPKIDVIFTTRNADCVDEHVKPQSIFKIREFSQKEANQFLRERCNDVTTQDCVVEELARELNRFPLALEQAGAFIHTSGLTIEDYLQMCKNSGGQLVQLLEHVNNQHAQDNSLKSVVHTWLISFQRIAEESALAAQQLYYMSVLSAHSIPREVLLPTDSKLELEFVKAMGVLRAYSMIEADSNFRNTRMHPLVHTVTRAFSTTLAADQISAFKSVAQLFPCDFNNHNDILVGDNLLSHAQVVLSYEATHCAKAELALRVSRFLQVKGSYSSALEFANTSVLESALHIGGIDHHDLAARTHLAWVHRCLGNFDEAYKMLCDILIIREETLGSEHPESIIIMHNKAILLRDCGKYLDAESLSLQVVDITEKVLGTRHKMFLSRIMNYAESLLRLKKYAMAEAQYRRAVEVAIVSRGPSDLDTLSSMSSLGVVLQEQGKLEEATEWHLKTIEGRAKILGQEHHQTLKAKANLALVHQGLGQFKESEKATRDILEVYTATLGEDHPDTLNMRYNLAVVLHHQNMLPDTLKVVQKLYELRRDKLGEEHRLTMESRAYAESLRAYLYRVEEVGTKPLSAISAKSVINPKVWIYIVIIALILRSLKF